MLDFTALPNLVIAELLDADEQSSLAASRMITGIGAGIQEADATTASASAA